MILRKNSSCLKILLRLGERNKTRSYNLRKFGICCPTNLMLAVKKLMLAGLIQREHINDRDYEYFLTVKGRRVRDMLVELIKLEGNL